MWWPREEGMRPRQPGCFQSLTLSWMPPNLRPAVPSLPEKPSGRPLTEGGTLAKPSASTARWGPPGRARRCPAPPAPRPVGHHVPLQRRRDVLLRTLPLQCVVPGSCPSCTGSPAPLPSPSVAVPRSTTSFIAVPRSIPQLHPIPSPHLLQPIPESEPSSPNRGVVLLLLFASSGGIGGSTRSGEGDGELLSKEWKDLFWDFIDHWKELDKASECLTAKCCVQKIVDEARSLLSEPLASIFEFSLTLRSASPRLVLYEHLAEESLSSVTALWSKSLVIVLGKIS